MPPGILKKKIANADGIPCVVARCGERDAKSWWLLQHADGSRSWCCGGQEGSAHRTARSGDGWRQWRPAEDVLPPAPPRPGEPYWWRAATIEQVRERIAAWETPPSPLLQALVEAADGVAWAEAALPAAIDPVLAPYAAAVAAVRLQLSVQTTQQSTRLTVVVTEDAALPPIGGWVGGLLFVVHVGLADVFERPGFRPTFDNTYFMWCFSAGDAPNRATLQDAASSFDEPEYTDEVVDGAVPRCTPFAWGDAQYELDLGLRLRKGHMIQLELQVYAYKGDEPLRYSPEEGSALSRFNPYLSDAMRGSLKDHGDLEGPWAAQVVRARAPAWHRIPGSKHKMPV
jgi:hypothetical protein